MPFLNDFFLVQTSETYENKQKKIQTALFLETAISKDQLFPHVYSYLQDGILIQNNNPLSIPSIRF